MKTKFIIILSAIIFILLIGCSTGPITGDSSYVSEEVGSSSSKDVALPTEAANSPSEASSDDISAELPVGRDLRKMVPDPYGVFLDKDIGYIKNVDEDSQQSFCITGIGVEDYKAYLSACRSNYGFTETLVDDSDYYVAEHYELPVRLELYYTEFEENPEDSYILVVVKHLEG